MKANKKGGALKLLPMDDWNSNLCLTCKRGGNYKGCYMIEDYAIGTCYDEKEFMVAQIHFCEHFKLDPIFDYRAHSIDVYNGGELITPCDENEYYNLRFETTHTSFREIYGENELDKSEYEKTSPVYKTTQEELARTLYGYGYYYNDYYGSSTVSIPYKEKTTSKYLYKNIKRKLFLVEGTALDDIRIKEVELDAENSGK